MAIDSGKIKLKQAGFNIIGAPVIMDAEYGSLSPVKAYFNYHINAKEFDIKRAYNEIKLFATSPPRRRCRRHRFA